MSFGIKNVNRQINKSLNQMLKTAILYNTSVKYLKKAIEAFQLQLNFKGRLTDKTCS